MSCRGGGGKGGDVYVWRLLLLQVLGGSPWHTQEGDHCRGERGMMGGGAVEGRRVCVLWRVGGCVCCGG